MATDPDVLAKLDELLAAVKGYEDPRRASAEWKQIYRLLQQAGVPSGRVNGTVGMRDVAGLTAMIEELRSNPSPAGRGCPAEGGAGEGPPDAETLRKALKAFRKRLNLTVLDEQSKLGHSPLTKGSDAGVPAIEPPREWPESVWQELVRQGKLRYIGHGFYELAKQ